MSSEESRLKKIARRAGRITLRVTLVVCGLLLVLGIFTQTSTFKELLRTQIIEATNDALLGRVEIGELDGNLFTGITTDSVRVYDANGKLAVAIEHARAHYSLFSLIQSELVISSLELERPTGIMRYDANGDLNLLQIAKPSEPSAQESSGAFGITVEDIKVTQGRLVYINEQTFAPESLEKNATELKRLSTLLDTADELTGSGLDESFRTILRNTSDLSADAVPSLAMVSGLAVKAKFSLGKQGTITVDVDPVTTLLDANTWTASLDFSSEKLDLVYASDRLELSTGRVKLGEDASGIAPMKLEVALIPAETETQTPYPTQIALDLESLTVTRALLDQVAPSLALKDGFSVSAQINGSPAVLKANSSMSTLAAPTTVKVEAALNGVLDTLMLDLELPPSAPKPASTPPSYQATLTASGVDPSALMADLPGTDINATLKLKGSGLNPKEDLIADVELVLDPSSAMGWKAESAQFKAEYADKALTISKGEVKTPYADATLTGTATWPGKVDLALTALATERHDRSVTVPDVGTIEQENLDLSATLSARFDLESDDIIQSLTATRLDARWDLAGLAQPGTLSLSQSKGKLMVDLSTTQNPATRAVELELDATARGLDTPDASVRGADITATSRVVTPWLPDDVSALRAALLANVDIRVEGVRAAGASVGVLDAKLALSPTSSTGRLDYTLTVNSLRNLSYPASDLRIGALHTRLAGEVGLSESLDLTYLAAQGSGSVANLNAAGQRVDDADFSVDVAGRPPLLRGKVNLDARGIDAGGQKLQSANLDATVKGNGDFTLTASATTDPAKPDDPDQTQKKPERLKIVASGNLSDSLDQVTGLNADIYNLNEDRDDPVWSIDDASISTNGGSIQVDGLSLVNDDQSIEIEGTYRSRGKQDLSVKAKNVELAELREELGLTSVLPDVKGEVETIDFTLSGTASEPEIVIDIVINDFYYETIGPFDLVLKGRYKNNKLTLNTLDLDGYGTDLIRGQARVPMSLDLDGNVDFFWKDDILVTFFVDPIKLDQLASQFSSLADYKLSGEISGGGILNGTLREPVLDFNVNATDITFKGTVADQSIAINNLSLTNRFEYEPPRGQEGGFKLDSKIKQDQRIIAFIDARSPIPLANWVYETVERGKEVDFATEVSTQQFSLKARFDKLELEELSEMGLTQGLKLGGIFDLVAKGNGTFEQPSLTLAASLNGLNVSGSLSGQQIDFRDIDFSSTFNLDGQRGSLDPVKLTANMNWQEHKVLDLAAGMNIPLNGWLTRTTRGEVIDFATELQTIPFNVDVFLDRLDLSQVAVAPLLKESDAAGVITSRLKAQGTLRDPTGTFTLNVGEMVCKSDPSQTKPCHGFGWDRYRDIVITTSLDLKDKLVTLEDFLLNWDNLDIAKAYGSLPLPMDTLLDGAPLKDIDYDFTLAMYPVPLNKMSAVDYTFASLTGAMKAKLHLTGSLRKPEVRGCFALLDAKLGENRSSVGSIGLDLDSRDQAVVGALKFCQSDGTAKAQNYDSICTLDQTQRPACAKGQTLAYANTAARVNTDLISLTQDGEVLAPSASSRKPQGPLQASDDIFVSIHTRDNKPLELQNVLPMSILKSFAREIRGTLAIDVDIKGSYEAPVPTGNLSLTNGSITLPSLGRRFDEIALAATMDSTTITLEKFRIAEGDADVRLTGKLNHDKLEPKTVTGELNADAFNVGDFVDFPFFASGKILLDGTLDVDPIDLNMNVSKLDIQLTEDIGSDLHPTELDGDILVLTRNQDGSLMIEGDIASADDELVGNSEDIMGGLSIKTRIKMSRDCWVRHPYGEVNITGDFTALLDGPSLTMSGEMEALRGQAEFLGKIFRVERALITFTGADPPDPRLQIEAAYELDQNIVASLGPASDGRPRIMVLISGNASDPSLKLRSDPVMSETDIIYVLATNRPPGTAGVGQDSSVAAAALSAASGLLVGMLKDELSDNLPLDFFDVLNVDTSNFEVGKYVYNGKIYLSYRYLFGNISGNSSIYQFDYHFFPRWTLEAQGSSGDDGGELNLNVFWDAF